MILQFSRKSRCIERNYNVFNVTFLINRRNVNIYNDIIALNHIIDRYILYLYLYMRISVIKQQA